MRVLASLAAVLVLLLLLPPPASSQVSLGFQGGLSLATLGGSDAADETDYKAGIGIGAFLAVPVSDLVSFQPEIAFMQKGAKESEDEYEIKVNLSYIEIPLLFKLNVPSEGTIAPFILVGPAVGFKTGCTLSGEEDGISVEVDCDEWDIDVKSMDIGGVLGAGLGVARGPGELLISARYNLGFMAIDDSEDEADVKNRGFSFLAGYSFPVGG